MCIILFSFLFILEHTACYKMLFMMFIFFKLGVVDWTHHLPHIKSDPNCTGENCCTEYSQHVSHVGKIIDTVGYRKNATLLIMPGKIQANVEMETIRP